MPPDSEADTGHWQTAFGGQWGRVGRLWWLYVDKMGIVNLLGQPWEARWRIPLALNRISTREWHRLLKRNFGWPSKLACQSVTHRLFLLFKVRGNEFWANSILVPIQSAVAALSVGNKEKRTIQAKNYSGVASPKMSSFVSRNCPDLLHIVECPCTKTMYQMAASVKAKHQAVGR